MTLELCRFQHQGPFFPLLLQGFLGGIWLPASVTPTALTSVRLRCLFEVHEKRRQNGYWVFTSWKVCLHLGLPVSLLNVSGTRVPCSWSLPVGVTNQIVGRHVPIFLFNSDCRRFWNLKAPHSGHSPRVLWGFGVHGNSDMSEVTLKTMCLTCERTRGRQEEEILQGRCYRGPKGSVAAVFRVTGKPLMYLFSCGLELVLATETEAEQQNILWFLIWLSSCAS